MSNVRYVSINKTPIKFQKSFGVLSRLFYGKGSKKFYLVNAPAINMLPADYRLGSQVLTCNVYKNTLNIIYVLVLCFSLYAINHFGNRSKGLLGLNVNSV